MMSGLGLICFHQGLSPENRLASVCLMIMRWTTKTRSFISFYALSLKSCLSIKLKGKPASYDCIGLPAVHCSVAFAGYLFRMLMRLTSHIGALRSIRKYVNCFMKLLTKNRPVGCLEAVVIGGGTEAVATLIVYMSKPRCLIRS